MPDAPPLTPADRAIVEAAAKGMAEHGMDIPLPWNGDLDDEERGRFDGLTAGLALALCVVAHSIDGGRDLMWSAGYIRDIAARLAEAGNE